MTLASRVFAQMPNPKDMSGLARPADDLPVGAISVRVIRGSFANNIPNQPVEFTVDGKTQTIPTDSDGRAQLSGLRPGTHVKAVTVVAGERLESQDVTMGNSGIRMMLVATDPNAPATPATPAVKGAIAFGPESRIFAEMAEDRLNVYYLLDVLNEATAPVDPGGPLILNLPEGARGAGLMQDATKQATVSGSHVTVLGPFAPGTTPVRVAFELPYDGSTAHIAQTFPASLPQVIAIVGQIGGLDVVSPQVTTKREVEDQGERIIAALGPALPAGQTLTLDITGLPHHPTWPRYLALGLAGSIMVVGIWAAAVGPSRRRAA
jgi:hypothetical protein